MISDSPNWFPNQLFKKNMNSFLDSPNWPQSQQFERDMNSYDPNWGQKRDSNPNWGQKRDSNTKDVPFFGLLPPPEALPLQGALPPTGKEVGLNSSALAGRCSTNERPPSSAPSMMYCTSGRYGFDPALFPPPQRLPDSSSWGPPDSSNSPK